MALSEADMGELLPSGTQTKFDNRVAWAKSYFVQAKVLDSPRRGYFRITPRGRELYDHGHKRIDIKILNQYPEFVEFHKGRAVKEGMLNLLLKPPKRHSKNHTTASVVTLPAKSSNA
jgi:restriction system protein